MNKRKEILSIILNISIFVMEIVALKLSIKNNGL